MSTVENALLQACDKVPIESTVSSSSLSFLFEGPARQNDFRFDDSQNNSEMLVQLGVFLDRQSPFIEPDFMLPLPSDCQSPIDAMMFPLTIATASPVLVPIGSNSLLSEMISSFSGINDSQKEVD